MFNYPPQSNSYVTWVIARIPADKIVDGAVSLRYVEGSAGISFGGWSRGLDYAQQQAKQAGEPRFVLPAVIGYRDGGAYIAQYVVGQGYMSVGVYGNGENAPVPRFTN
jgi:hypothetical protein